MKIAIYLILLVFQSTFGVEKDNHLDIFIKKYNHRKANHLGPNCFATALAATNVLPYSGYVDGKQMQLLMESSLCERIHNDNEVLRGDIQLVFNEKNNTRTPIHAAVFLNKTTVFEKASNSSSTPPMITSKANSLSPYPTRNHLVQTYRCSNFREYLKKQYPNWYNANERVINQFFLRDERVAKMVETHFNHPDAIRMTVTSLASSLRSLQFAGADQNFEYPNHLGLKETIWSDAPTEIKLIFQMRFTDMIYQVQNLLYTNIISGRKD